MSLRPVIRNQKRTLYLILALAPAIFILVPSLFGYYLYSPINNGFIQVGWFAFFVWMWVGEIEKGEEKKSWKRHKIGLALVGIWLVFGYMSASFGSGMEHVVQYEMGRRYEDEKLIYREYYCEPISYYVSPAVDAGIMNMLSFGGGSYIDTAVSLYKTDRTKDFFDSQEICRENTES